MFHRYTWGWILTVWFLYSLFLPSFIKHLDHRIRQLIKGGRDSVQQSVCHFIRAYSFLVFHDKCHSSYELRETWLWLDRVETFGWSNYLNQYGKEARTLSKPLYAISDQTLQMIANDDHESQVSVSKITDVSMFMMREAKSSSELTCDIIACGSPVSIHMAV